MTEMVTMRRKVLQESPYRAIVGHDLTTSVGQRFGLLVIPLLKKCKLLTFKEKIHSVV